ncbi:hypothetical protein [Tuwongella immobilis]|uniref:Uncharacterized protein n=1 Tax=Tuwongella immobilis TaxID=692036 RepID=A0A6C2YV35_9BACT|nr:hypothetical protein [Tuwongella immobilis]VIP05366.1 Uncharacterized protein OS=Planctomyces brasiliensis (strain ATCC 49424 / DSM 5305 / JCM 21570 / NBRC 103401 / IFAM 1448) GN=Plabr_1214 PE=4 SV=1 [Tuwongella immobilis]VTS08088.1 Uncharacterized protein OS=Planctomyces brasiliensis (strain ATCC 49424 / DSM 5305 / JCM 21570 / NBRC 103401 / IFAM 1448) GN=Plabr_1214 PE=4 SV=1 [Tuwongella immobilis]
MGWILRGREMGAVVGLVALSVIGLSPMRTVVGADSATLFEDRFEGKLAERWQAVGLKSADYRIDDGALEIRMQPGLLDAKTPRLQVLLPINVGHDTVVASVRVTMRDAFREPGELAGLILLDEFGPEFSVRKERIAGKTLFRPGPVRFTGKPGEEGDPTKYTTTEIPAMDAAGPLRLIVDRGYAFAQIGPSQKDDYLNLFHSAIRKESRQRGFALVAVGAPRDANRWVRFEDFRITRR